MGSEPPPIPYDEFKGLEAGKDYRSAQVGAGSLQHRPNRPQQTQVPHEDSHLPVQSQILYANHTACENPRTWDINDGREHNGGKDRGAFVVEPFPAQWSLSPGGG